MDLRQTVSSKWGKFQKLAKHQQNTNKTQTKLNSTQHRKKIAMAKVYTEFLFQRQIVRMFKQMQHYGQIPNEYILFCINNNHRTKKEGAVGVAMGQLAGVSDLILLTPYKVIFLELKTDKGRQSENQRDFQKSVDNLGRIYEYRLIRTFEEFISIFAK